jgi:hypothetical protein
LVHSDHRLAERQALLGKGMIENMHDGRSSRLVLTDAGLKEIGTPF